MPEDEQETKGTGLMIDRKVGIGVIMALIAYGVSIVIWGTTTKAQVDYVAKEADESKASIAQLRSDTSKMDTITYRIDNMDARMARIEQKIDALK